MEKDMEGALTSLMETYPLFSVAIFLGVLGFMTLFLNESFVGVVSAVIMIGLAFLACLLGIFSMVSIGVGGGIAIAGCVVATALYFGLRRQKISLPLFSRDFTSKVEGKKVSE
jgi:hypothetical protein